MYRSTNGVYNDKRFKISTSVEKNMEIILKRLLFIIGFGYYRIESSRLNALKSTDVWWYGDAFGMMHRYSTPVPCIAPSLIIMHPKYLVNSKNS